MATSPKLHSSSILYITICLLCILAFCIVGIYPNVENMKELDDIIAELKTKAQRQELLFPVYTRLIKEVQIKAPALPLPQKTKMARNDIERLNTHLIEIAEKNGVVLDSAIPDAVSYLEDSGQLTMNLVVHGDFFKFQNLLLDISQIPYLAAIDKLGIYPHVDGKQMKLKIRLDQE